MILICDLSISLSKHTKEYGALILRDRWAIFSNNLMFCVKHFNWSDFCNKI